MLPVCPWRRLLWMTAARAALLTRPSRSARCSQSFSITLCDPASLRCGDGTSCCTEQQSSCFWPPVAWVLLRQQQAASTAWWSRGVCLTVPVQGLQCAPSAEPSHDKHLSALAVQAC